MRLTVDRDALAEIVERVAAEGLPGPRDLDSALDAILSLVPGEMGSGKSPENIAAAIIQRANEGYHSDAKNYPAFALLSWDDRPRWSEYIRQCAVEVLRSPND